MSHPRIHAGSCSAATLATTLAMSAAQAIPGRAPPGRRRPRPAAPGATVRAPARDPHGRPRGPGPTPRQNTKFDAGPAPAPRTRHRERPHTGPADRTLRRAAQPETRRRALHPRRHHRPEPRAVRGLPRRPGRHGRRLPARPRLDLGRPAHPGHVRRPCPGRRPPRQQPCRRPRRQERQPSVRDVHLSARGGLPGLLARRDRRHRRPHRRRRTPRHRRLRLRRPHLRCHPVQRRTPCAKPSTPPAPQAFASINSA